MIINAINESEANVIGFIESECGSMATFIFLACHTWGVSEAAEFFCHTCSYGTWGKEHENFSQAEFLRRQQHKMTRKRYKNFLDEDQIERLLLGQDVYLDADEIMDRLEVYADARDSQGCGNPECTECGVQEDEGEPMPTLQQMIAEAVAEGVKSELDRREKAERKRSSKEATKSSDAAKKKLNQVKEISEYLEKLSK
ncbi:hypothetical protein D3C86_1597390 [compost metagenome]